MSAPVFRTDVNIRSSNTQSLLDRPANTKGLTSAEYLDQAAESTNKQIDTDIKAMLDGFEALVGLSRVRHGERRILFLLAELNLLPDRSRTRINFG